MMKVLNLKKLFAAGIVLVVSLTMAIGVLADLKTNDVDVTIKSGEFSIKTSPIDSFGDITLEEEAKTYNTSFTEGFIVKDLRGTQTGWRLDVSASQFADRSNMIPKGSLSLDPVSNITRVGTGSGDSPSSSMDTKTIIDDGKIEVAKAVAGSGMGVFEITFPIDALALTVDPTTAKVGTYESTITWSLVNAP